MHICCPCRCYFIPLIAARGKLCAILCLDCRYVYPRNPDAPEPPLLQPLQQRHRGALQRTAGLLAIAVLGIVVAAATAVVRFRSIHVVVIHEAANATDMPIHLPIGRDCVTELEAKLAQIPAELAPWREKSLVTTYTDTPPAPDVGPCSKGAGLSGVQREPAGPSLAVVNQECSSVHRG